MKTNDKYIEVKGKLQKLKYRFHFDITHCHQIETLIDDIVKQSYEITNLKSEKEVQKMELQYTQLNLSALEKENNKLIKENNQLHKELIDINKHFSNANASRELELQRLNEEKNSIKYMLLNAKKKCDELIKENDLMKIRHSTLITGIYDKNFSERSLRKLYELDCANMNIETENNDLGVYVKKRDINMTSDLNLSNLNVNNSMLKEVIRDTFIPQHSQADEDTNELESKLSMLQIENNQLINKIKSLEGELKIKSFEITKLNNIGSSVSGRNNDTVVIKFLREENENLKEKLDKRVEFLVIQNKKYEEKIKQLNEKIKKFNNSMPYLNSLEKEIFINKKQMGLLSETNKTLEISLRKLNESYSYLKKEYNTHLESAQNETEKMSSKKQEEFNKLFSDFASTQETLIKLDSQLQETRASSSSTNRLISDELRFTNEKFDELKLSNTKLLDQIKDEKKQQDVLIEKNNLLNHTIILKEKEIKDLNEKILTFILKVDKVNDDKKYKDEEIKELHTKIDKLRHEYIIKDAMIDKLENENYLLQKENEILTKKNI
jgi:chromosome segregation ATPase